MEIPDDILIRFSEEAADDFRWHETAHRCEDCGIMFATGDVTVIHGELRDEMAKVEHRCVGCGYQKIVNHAAPPSGMGVHVARALKRKRLSEMSPGDAERIVEAFRVISGVERHMKELVGRSRTAEEGEDGKSEA